MHRLPPGGCSGRHGDADAGPTPLSAVSGVSAVIIIRGNEKAYNLVLDAVKVPVTGVIQPGSWQVFGASFGRDYGDLYGGYEVMVQGSSQMPGILEAP